MATLFSDLFNEFLQTEVNSVDLATKYTQPQLSNYLSILLKRAREEFFSFANINPPSTIPKMQDCIEFWSQEFNFTLTGATPTTTLNPIPNTGSLFYITVDGVATTNYTYTSGTGSITINGMSSSSHSIDIIAYVNGQFNQTLSFVEQGITIDWMGVIYQKDKIKQQRLFNLAITGRDDGMASQANHIRALQATYEYDRNKIMQRMYEYTYLSDPNKLSGMGGKG